MRTTLLTAVLLAGAIQGSPPTELGSVVGRVRGDVTASVPAAQQPALLARLDYFLSRYLFAPLRGPAAGDADAARASLNASDDHSIAELLLQLADEGVSGNVPAQRRGAAAVLDDILPSVLRCRRPVVADRRDGGYRVVS